MNLKTGKLKAKKDSRNIKFKRIVSPALLPSIPASYDVDKEFSFPIPSRMFCNDEWGCCVIAARANQTLRFEAAEQHRALNILDSQILEEYWREGGGDSSTKPDNGLYMLDSLKSWRSQGWLSRGYNIYAFAQINWKDPSEVKAAIFLLKGVSGGVVLHQSDMDQFETGKPWSVVSKPGKVVGGHALYWKAFSPSGLICRTWGQDQFVTWEWFFKNTDELYAVVDNRDKFLKNSPVDVAKLDRYLKAVVG
jgi:hypothetical protein